MNDNIIPFPLHRAGYGTTNEDLACAAAFVRHRPGWNVEQITGSCGKALILHTANQDSPWVVTRTRTELTLASKHNGNRIGLFKNIQQLLLELYEMKSTAQAA